MAYALPNRLRASDPTAAEQDYSVIDKIARVHRVAEGDWTTASEIANDLGYHRPIFTDSERDTN